jgi:sugar phosphate isomerase/epimerase
MPQGRKRMKGDIREYARLGLTHHLLYPRCVDDPGYHARTLTELVRRDDIETLDCCIPYDPEHRRRLVPLLRNCGKEVVYALHLFPVRTISYASPAPLDQGLVRVAIRDQIEVAQAAGARALVFGSGPCGSPAKPAQAKAAFADFCRWVCRELRPFDMTALLEPFDTDVDKKFLYGPIKACVKLVQALRPQHANFGIELDIAHLPLMRENFENAIRRAAPFLQRVHLGNCVLKNKASTLYGDKHPPIGIEGGEIDVPELVRVLRTLREVGYLDRARRGALVFEIRPFPKRSVAFTVSDNMRRLEQAWERV